MSTAGNEYVLSIRLDVTNLDEVRNAIRNLGAGVGGGGAGGGGSPSSGGGGGGSASKFGTSIVSYGPAVGFQSPGGQQGAGSRSGGAVAPNNAIATISQAMALGAVNPGTYAGTNGGGPGARWVNATGGGAGPQTFPAAWGNLNGWGGGGGAGGRGGGGGGGRFAGGGGGFFGAPNPMGLYFAGTFGAYEVGAAVTGMAQANTNAAIAPDRVSRMQAELQGATAGFGGVLGSTAGLIMDAFGAGPASITRSMTGAIGSVQTGYSLADSRITLSGARAGFSAGSGRFASQRANRSDIAANTQFSLAQRAAGDNIRELEGRLTQDAMSVAYNADKLSGKTTSWFEEFSGYLDTKPTLSANERDTINNRLGTERNNLASAGIARDEALRRGREDRSLALFGNQQAAAQSSVNAFMQGSSFSSTDAYRMSRQVQARDMMFGRHIFEPGVAAMMGAFNTETNATADRMDQVRNTEISQLMRTEMMTTEVSRVGGGRSTRSSREAAIRGRYNIELDGISLVTSPDVRAAREGAARANRDADMLANDVAFNDTRSDIRSSQRTSGRQLAALEGRYGYAAGALGISGGAVLAATQLRRQEMYGEADATLGLAQRAIGLERRNYLEAFRGTQFDVRNIGISTRDQENVGATLKGIADAMDEVITAIKELVSN